MAVAGVGALYMADDWGEPNAEMFYDIARYYLDELINSRPYEAIKIFTLFALYNVLNKAAVALSYTGELYRPRLQPLRVD
jgi:hypothetical protein